MINVTRANLPPLEEYEGYLKRIWENRWLTNQGPLVQELEKKLSERLEVPHIQFVTNGTIALQIPIRALELTGEIITTPFSYVATTTSILWEQLTPVFADIDPNTFCIDPASIEARITPKTSAILATHVYGYPCAVEAIEAIAQTHGLKVIYDGAHAFGVRYKGKSIFQWGDVSTLSFHATKLFHTVEGGAMICQDEQLFQKLYLYKAFGHIGDDYYSMGINGKNSEFHAAMGLCNISRVDSFIEGRKHNDALYRNLLEGLPLHIPSCPPDTEYNYAYFPVVFKSEEWVVRVREALLKAEINTRRYFYPSLNRLPYLQGGNCPVSEDIASRVLCLPHYQELAHADMEKITREIRKVFTL